MTKIPVVVLAGKPPKRDDLLEYADKDNKVLIEHQGKTLVQITLDAIRDAGIASKIVLIGIAMDELPFDVLEYDIPISFHAIQGTQYDKIYQGAKYVLDSSEGEDFSHVLYMSSDMPHLHGEVIKNYIELVNEDPSADLYYSIVRKEDALRGLPDFDWGYMKIKDGKYVSGNLTFVRLEKIMDKYEMIKFVSENRKGFIWGVLKASPWMFLKLIFGRITLKEAERLMSSFFKLESRLIVSKNYELGFDLDHAEDLEFLRQISN